MREKLLSITIRVLRQILAIMTLIFPDLLGTYTKTKTRQRSLSQRQEEIGETESAQNCEDLAKLII